MKETLRKCLIRLLMKQIEDIASPYPEEVPVNVLRESLERAKNELMYGDVESARSLLKQAREYAEFVWEEGRVDPYFDVYHHIDEALNVLHDRSEALRHIDSALAKLTGGR